MPSKDWHELDGPGPARVESERHLHYSGCSDRNIPVLYTCIAATRPSTRVKSLSLNIKSVFRCCWRLVVEVD